MKRHSGLHAFALLFLASTVFFIALAPDDACRFNSTSSAFRSEASRRLRRHRHSMPCCSAGSCARDGHHMKHIAAFWHEDLEPLANAPDEQNWHVIRDAGGYNWGKEIVTI